MEIFKKLAKYTKREKDFLLQGGINPLDDLIGERSDK